jgi:hypothetical protein
MPMHGLLVFRKEKIKSAQTVFYLNRFSLLKYIICDLAINIR